MANEIHPIEAPSPKAALGYDGEDFIVLSTDADGQLQVDVVASGLPAGAAREAKQDTMITILDVIDNLVHALQSVDTDKLQVRGEDQLFSFKDKLFDVQANTNTGVGDIGLDSATVPAGEVWVVTRISAYSDSTTITKIFHQMCDAVGCENIMLFPDYVRYDLFLENYELYLVEDDYISGLFFGCSAGDSIWLSIYGYKMTKE